ncbi:MAG TPA: DNA-3-methyladenine glycosylase [Candidatus Nitrosotenuis sp.]|jgi:DNA-3-methyladenine glycosylase|nr:DNA-3-methyladenine glycosylase [Candidatus Nitrosotenuis sp.]
MVLAAPFPPSFFARDTAAVARDLVGAWLVHRTPEGEAGGRIVETEAYYGTDDPASHAFRGPTPRARIMFGEPGLAYVYFVYGNHYCLNAVAHLPGDAGAVLIRALEPRLGLDLMRRRRGQTSERLLTSGPGRLCAALAIDRSCNGLPLTSGPLFLAPAAEPLSGRLRVGPRVGIRVAVEAPLRFYLEGNPYVSTNRNSVPSVRP